MKFTKLQAAGNDFIVVDDISRRVDWSTMAKRWCDHHYGIGADGLIIVKKESRSAVEMRIFNPDGSEAESCGNGLRCTAKYAVEKGIVDQKVFTVRTLAGDATVDVSGFERTPKCVESVMVTMTEPVFQPADIPVRLPVEKTVPIIDYPLSVEGLELRLSFVSMGNPHAVALIRGNLSTFPLQRIGPIVEHHRMFPRRTNFEVAKVINRRTIRARVWERGAGETLACGTGACAIAVSACLKKLVDSPVNVLLPGGNLSIEWSQGERVRMAGPAAEVFKGEIRL